MEWDLGQVEREVEIVRGGIVEGFEVNKMGRICNQCGRSVAFGSGRFMYRIPDLHSVEERRAMGKPFPEGDYLCLDCAIGV